MKLLITGAAGFIGMHLCMRMVKMGHSVVGIDNLNSYYDVELKHARLSQLNSCEGDFLFEKIDIIDKESLATLFSAHHFDTVCNLAAQAGVRYSISNPETYIESNLCGFYNILEACRNFKVSHLVYASSSSVYGKNEKLPYSVEDKTDSPVSLYAATKKAGELLAYSYTHLYDFKATGLRFFTVYGPWGRPDMAPYLFTSAILNNKTMKVFNNGDMYRDFTYIDDIIDGIVATIENPPKEENHRVFNLGNNHPVSLMDFIKIIEQTAGKEAQKEFLPMQQGDVYYTYADIKESSTQLNYTPKVGLKEGISKFVKWYKEWVLKG